MSKWQGWYGHSMGYASMRGAICLPEREFPSIQAAALFWRKRNGEKRLWVAAADSRVWREVDAAGNVRPSREVMAADLEGLAQALIAK
jgi:hypothetical protein